jgi:hypothetical protein
MLEWIVGIAAVLVLIQLERVLWELSGVQGSVRRVELVLRDKPLPPSRFEDDGT